MVKSEITELEMELLRSKDGLNPRICELVDGVLWPKVQDFRKSLLMG